MSPLCRYTQVGNYVVIYKFYIDYNEESVKNYIENYFVMLYPHR